MRASSGFAIGVDQSHVAFRGFLIRKTTPRDPFGGQSNCETARKYRTQFCYTRLSQANSMNRLVIGNLLHRPLRSSISILAVAIEVTMILAIVGIMVGMIQGNRT